MKLTAAFLLLCFSLSPPLASSQTQKVMEASPNTALPTTMEKNSSGAGGPTVTLPAEIEALLVTDANPARTDLDGMDYERCAALHNYLLDYSLTVKGYDPEVDSDTFMNFHGAAAEALVPRLHPSVAAFFAAARRDIRSRPPEAVFFFASNFYSPPAPGEDGDGGLFDNWLADMESEPDDTYVYLYHTFAEVGGESNGLLYHQGRHRAAYFLHLDDMDFGVPID
jgi:hypothetical protein